MAYNADAALRRLRCQVDTVRLRAGSNLRWSDVADLIAELRSLAIATQRDGLAAYASLCFHLAERIDDFRHHDEVSRTLLLWFDLWMDSSDSYLNAPASPAALKLLELLNDPFWSSPFSEFELHLLLHALTQSGAPIPPESLGGRATKYLWSTD